MSIDHKQLKLKLKNFEDRENEEEFTFKDE